HREPARVYSATVWLNPLLLSQILKELIEGEAEADQRGRRPDPGHQRPIVSEQRAVQRKLRRSRKWRLARIIIDRHPRILLSRSAQTPPRRFRRTPLKSRNPVHRATE